MNIPPTPFWMTRDLVHGVLSEYVDVWNSYPPAPERFADGDVIFAQDVDVRHVACWTIAEAKKCYPGAPDSPSEVVRVGREP